VTLLQGGVRTKREEKHDSVEAMPNIVRLIMTIRRMFTPAGQTITIRVK
jgi:hypothetical protein